MKIVVVSEIVFERGPSRFLVGVKKDVPFFKEEPTGLTQAEKRLLILSTLLGTEDNRHGTLQVLPLGFRVALLGGIICLERTLYPFHAEIRHSGRIVVKDSNNLDEEDRLLVQKLVAFTAQRIAFEAQQMHQVA